MKTHKHTKECDAARMKWDEEKINMRRTPDYIFIESYVILYLFSVIFSLISGLVIGYYLK